MHAKLFPMSTSMHRGSFALKRTDVHFENEKNITLIYLPSNLQSLRERNTHNYN